MKKIIENVKLFFKIKVKTYIVEKLNILKETVIKFYNEKVSPWIKRNWFGVSNLFVLLIVHLLINNVSGAGFADFIVKSWLILIILYYIYHVFKKHIIIK